MPTMNDAPATPYRKSLLRLDVAEYVMVEPPNGGGRSADELRRKPAAVASSSGVHLLPGYAWELQPLQINLGYAHERQETANAVESFILPDGFSTLAVYRKPSDQPGALTGASSNISDTGDPFIKKKVGSADDWDDPKFRHQADMDAMASPGIGDDTAVMDRLGIAVTVYGPNAGFFVRFRIAGGKITASQKALEVYFNGPAGAEKDFVGTGYYGASICGDGNIVLYERGVSGGSLVFRERATFRFCPPQVATTGTHRIYIRPVKFVNPADISGLIFFYHEGTDRTSGTGKKTSFTSINNMAMVQSYAAPSAGDSVPTETLQPRRVGMRRTERHEIQISRPVYPNSGVLQDDPFTTDSYLVDTTPLRLYWRGQIPSGCALTMRCYDALTGVELTAEGTTGTWVDDHGNAIGGYRFYTVQYPQRQFYVKAFFTGAGDFNGGTHSTVTPTLEQWFFIKDGRVDDVAPEEVTTKITNFTMTGQDHSPSHESAGAGVADLTDSLDILSYRSSIPFILQTQYDPDDPTKVSHLMRGWIQRADAARMGSKIPAGLGSASLADYPASTWKAHTLQMLGQWMRLSVARMPFRWDFKNPVDEDRPLKVTDIIRQGFAFAGMIDDQLDIPDIPLRMFWGRQGDERPSADPLVDIGELMVDLAMNYLGQWLCFDPNAQVAGSSVDRGLWRLRPQGTTNNPVLAHFHTEAASDGNALAALTATHYLPAYPLEATTWTDPNGDEQTQNTQHSYVKKRSLRTFVRHPEANLITVTGTGNQLFGSGREADTAITVTLANPNSFNFAGLDPSDPKYPSATNNPDYLPYIAPYVYPDSNIRNLEGAQWVARRIYERICHGSKVITFEAPLLLIWDSADDLQIRPRPLRFYDLVMVNGIKFYVRSVNISYKKDRAQMAVYELELPNGVLY